MLRGAISKLSFRDTVGSTRFAFVRLLISENAYITASLLAIPSKWVAKLTKDSFCELRRRTCSAKNIDSWWYERDVRRICAAAIITNDMVELWNGFCEPPRQRSDEPRVHHSMYRFCSAVIPSSSVTVTVCTGSPVPATCDTINVDVREDPSKRLAVEVGNREILQVSHIRYLHSRWRAWLESSWRLYAASTRLFYHKEIAA